MRKPIRKPSSDCASRSEGSSIASFDLAAGKRYLFQVSEGQNMSGLDHFRGFAAYWAIPAPEIVRPG